MKIPKQVKIGWRIYIVKLIPDLKDEKEEFIYGITDFVDKTIFINKDIDENEKKATLLHEIFHCIYHAQSHTDWKDNEDLCNASAEGLFQLMKDNPKIFT